MSLPVSQYEALLIAVRGLKEKAQHVQQLANPLLQQTSPPSSTTDYSSSLLLNTINNTTSTHNYYQKDNWDSSVIMASSNNFNQQECNNSFAMKKSLHEKQLEQQQYYDEDVGNAMSVSNSRHNASSNSNVANSEDEFTSSITTNHSANSEPPLFNSANVNKPFNNLYHGTWPVQSNAWGSAASADSMSTPMDMTSVMSFNSSSGGVPLDRVLNSSSPLSRRSSQQLEAKVDMVYSLLAMLGGQEHADMGETLLALSTNPESCLAMRQSGCVSLLVQMVHSDKDSSTRKKASQALQNLINAQPDEKLRKRESRVLKLLEQLRMYNEALLGHIPFEMIVLSPTSEELPENDKHPVQVIAHIMKLSFDEGHRQSICQLGGIQVIANLIECEHSVHGSGTMTTSNNEQSESKGEGEGEQEAPSSCILMRRYACMALTNLTFGDSGNKALLCSFRHFMLALVAQLKSTSDELRQVTASVLRNLSWRADPVSKTILREVGTVSALMKAAMIDCKENTLKSILSALWNLSAHCIENKSEICSVEGALAFLVKMLTYKTSSSTKSLAVIENSGGILRNISSHIAIREDYRLILRQHNCLKILLDHLKSPSLTIVSNACGALWNLSAKCVEDQEKLWEMGAPSMLRSLNHSKHKMIAMGSSAALKNLLASRPSHSLMQQLDSTALSMDLPTLPTLNARRQKALMQDLEQSCLSETYENIEEQDSTLTTENEEKHSNSTKSINKLTKSFAQVNISLIQQQQQQQNEPLCSSLTTTTTTKQKLFKSTPQGIKLKIDHDEEEEEEEKPVNYAEKVKNQVQTSSNANTNTNTNSKIYAETDLDLVDQPTDYSLKYGEDDDLIEERKTHVVEEQEDTLKTYCTEGTPYETPYLISNATSMSDLQIANIDNDLSVQKIASIQEKDDSSEKDRCSVDEDLNVNVNFCSSSNKEENSGLMSPEKPVNYCEEGTPGYFSRVSSFGSLNSIPNNVEQDNDDKLMKKAAEECDEKKIAVSLTAEQTPLMFSRSSSLASLNSVEQHSIVDDGSVISDFSRLQSGIISPSEIPDSPTLQQQQQQSAILSPLLQQQQQPQAQPRNRSTNAKITMKRPQPTPRSLKSVFEDDTTKFKEESTPVKFASTANSSLSSLITSTAADDRENDDEDEVEEGVSPLIVSGIGIGRTMASGASNSSSSTPAVVAINHNYFELNQCHGNEDENDEDEEKKDNSSEKCCVINDSMSMNKDEESELSENDENDDDILANCINIGMQSKSQQSVHHQLQPSMQLTNNIGSKSFLPKYQPSAKTSSSSSSISNQLRGQLGNVENRSRLSAADVSSSSFSSTSNQLRSQHGNVENRSRLSADASSSSQHHNLNRSSSSSSYLDSDCVMPYCTEDTPAEFLSRVGSNSDLSVLSLINDSNSNSNKNNVNKEELNLSDDSSSNLSVECNEKIILEKCIESAMPKPKKSLIQQPSPSFGGVHNNCNNKKGNFHVFNSGATAPPDLLRHSSNLSGSGSGNARGSGSLNLSCNDDNSKYLVDVVATGGSSSSSLHRGGAVSTAVPSFLLAKDEVSNYAVENSPCLFSVRSSLSDLTIDGLDLQQQQVGGGGGGNEIRSQQFRDKETDRKTLSSTAATALASSSSLSAGAVKSREEQQQEEQEGNVSRSRNNSLSSISVESVGSIETEQALLEQCISSGMPSNNRNKENSMLLDKAYASTTTATTASLPSSSSTCSDNHKLMNRSFNLNLNNSKNVNATSVINQEQQQQNQVQQVRKALTAANIEEMMADGKNTTKRSNIKEDKDMDVEVQMDMNMEIIEEKNGFNSNSNYNSNNFNFNNKSSSSALSSNSDNCAYTSSFNSTYNNEREQQLLMRGNDELDFERENEDEDKEFKASSVVNNRMLDPNAMIESLDRLTAKLISHHSHLQVNSAANNTMMTTATSTQNASYSLIKDKDEEDDVKGGDTWNDENSSSNDVTFPSLSGSIPNVITFPITETSLTSSYSLVQGNKDKLSNTNSSKQQESWDECDGINLNQNSMLKNDFSSLEDTTNTNTSTMTESTLIAIEATKLATTFLQATTANQQSGSELDKVNPPSNMASLVNSAIDPDFLNSKPSSPKLGNKHHKNLPITSIARKALSNSIQNSSTSCSNSLLMHGSVEENSLTNLDCINPPSFLLMSQDLLQRSITTSMESLPQELESVDLQQLNQPLSLIDIENVNPPSLFNEITDYCNSLADINTETICSHTEVFEDCFTHIDSSTKKQEPDFGEIEDEITENDVSEISSVENSPIKKSFTTNKQQTKRHLTPKQKRNLARDRYKTYTVAAEMVGLQVTTNEEEFNCEDDDLSFNSSYKSAKEDITLTQNNVNTSTNTNVDDEATVSCMQERSSSVSNRRKSSPKEKRQNDRSRFQTQTLSKSVINMLHQKNVQKFENFDDEILQREANLVLQTLNESAGNSTSKIDDLLIDCETLSLVSNDDDSSYELQQQIYSNSSSPQHNGERTFHKSVVEKCANTNTNVSRSTSKPSCSSSSFTSSMSPNFSMNLNENLDVKQVDDGNYYRGEEEGGSKKEESHSHYSSDNGGGVDSSNNIRTINTNTISKGKGKKLLLLSEFNQEFNESESKSQSQKKVIDSRTISRMPKISKLLSTTTKNIASAARSQLQFPQQQQQQYEQEQELTINNCDELTMKNCEKMHLIEGEGTATPTAKIVKPGDDALVCNGLENEQEEVETPVKAVRGRRKPLYAKSTTKTTTTTTTTASGLKKSSPGFSPLHSNSNSNQLVKNVTSSIKAQSTRNSSFTQNANKTKSPSANSNTNTNKLLPLSGQSSPKKSTSNSRPPVNANLNASRRPLSASNNLLQNLNVKASSSSSTNVSSTSGMSSGIPKFGQSAVQQSGNLNLSRIPSVSSSNSNSSKLPLAPHSRIARAVTTIGTISTSSASSNSGFQSSKKDGNVSVRNKLPVYSSNNRNRTAFKSSSADRSSSSSSIPLNNLSNGQKQAGGGMAMRAVVSNNELNKVQSSNSSSSSSSSSKQITSKIASLWKKIEESKKQQQQQQVGYVKKDNRKWIQKEESVDKRQEEEERKQEEETTPTHTNTNTHTSTSTYRLLRSRTFDSDEMNIIKQQQQQQQLQHQEQC